MWKNTTREIISWIYTPDFSIINLPVEASKKDYLKVNIDIKGPGTIKVMIKLKAMSC